MSIEISVDEVPGGTVVAVEGEVDLATAPDLQHAIEAAMESGGTVWADLSGVTFMDSSGLRALLSARMAAEPAGGSLVVVAPEGPVRRLLDLTGLIEELGVTERLDTRET